MSVPFITTVPLLGRSIILIHLTSVLLPAPLIPIIPYISPSLIVSEISFNASTVPSAISKDLQRFLISIILKSPFHSHFYVIIPHSGYLGNYLLPSSQNSLIRYYTILLIFVEIQLLAKNDYFTASSDVCFPPYTPIGSTWIAATETTLVPFSLLKSSRYGLCWK